MSTEQIITTIAELPDEERRKVWAELDELRRSDPAAPEPKPLSAHDKAKHLIGSISGPRDLSSNKKYLKDLGKTSLS